MRSTEELRGPAGARRFAVAVVFLLFGGVVACGNHVEVETFDAEIADIRSQLDSHDARISQVESDMTDLAERHDREIQALRDDFQAKITELEEAVRFAMPVNFEFDRAEVRNVDRPVLDRFASVMTNFYEGATITVEGFTDRQGAAWYNQQLSERRAQAVKDYLVEQAGLDADRIRAVGYGEDRDRLLTDETGPGESGIENRRVTFVVERPGR